VQVTLASLALVLLTAGAASAQGEVVDVSDTTTPACDMAGLVARPAAGSFNVPFHGPPRGHRGYQMMRVNERQELVGIIRVRSATEPSAEFTDKGFGALLANEAHAVSEMEDGLASESLWSGDNVPTAGAGFREGRAVGVAGALEGNDVGQEAHFLVFRSDTAKYVFTLLTPQTLQPARRGDSFHRPGGRDAVHDRVFVRPRIA
jgi:hypothetical protein